MEINFNNSSFTFQNLCFHYPSSFQSQSIIFEHFLKWFFGSLHKVTLSSLSDQQAMALQRRALSLITDTQPSFVDTLINIYHLSSLDPTILRLHIVRLQALNCYKEVSSSFDLESKIKANTKYLFSISTLNYSCFSQAVVLSVKLKLQRELNMEEVRKHFQQMFLYNLLCIFIHKHWICECTCVLILNSISN